MDWFVFFSNLTVFYIMGQLREAEIAIHSSEMKSLHLHVQTRYHAWHQT